MLYPTFSCLLSLSLLSLSLSNTYPTCRLPAFPRYKQSLILCPKVVCLRSPVTTLYIVQQEVRCWSILTFALFFKIHGVNLKVKIVIGFKSALHVVPSFIFVYGKFISLDWSVTRPIFTTLWFTICLKIEWHSIQKVAPLN